MSKAESLAKKIFSDQDLEAISQAIKSFEKQTSGEIVISFNTTSHNQPYKTTRKIFEKAKLHETKERNATLIAMFLSEQKFAIYGDVGIHEKVPSDFWELTVAEMKTHFAAGRMQEGLLHGIRELGNNLAKYFPVQADDVNELSDQINYEGSIDE
ncbi:MAG: TPM domain-containing protein [Candidatus Marinimicrobia bacterium]|nr:TPM domain-containing protein [Candidatus Neomarinimicrobiota bacterium]